MKIKIAVLIAAMSIIAGPLSAEVLIKDGDSIAFLGDSITYYGNIYPMGYLHLVIDGLQRAGIRAIRIPAGISGHKSNNMLARLQRDVISKKPTWMTLSCGVNDVWHGEKGVKLEDYKKNILLIVHTAKKAGIKVMILTSTMIGENPYNDNNIKLAAYNNFLRQLAKQYKCPIADLNAIMQKQIQEMKKADKKPAVWKNYLTTDGVHMAREGNIMMAAGILAAFGIPEQQITEYKKAWKNYPRNTTIRLQFTIAEWEKLSAKAKKVKKTPHEYVENMVLKDIQ